MEQKPVINIALATDEGYFYQAMVVIATIINSLSDSERKLAFYILVPGAMSDSQKNAFDELIIKHSNCTINIIDMADSYQDADLHIEHITRPAYYRLSLPELLPTVDKILYLDCDVVVCKNIATLFDMVIDDYYIAGVRAFAFLSNPNYMQIKMKELDIPSLDQYVNSGILLMNLKKMRDEDLCSVFKEKYLKNYTTQDQDIFNSACYGKIKLIDFKYNTMTKYPLFEGGYHSLPYLRDWISFEEFEKARTEPVIIHYADKCKPWNDCNSLFLNDWWEATRLLPEKSRLAIVDKYMDNLLLSISQKVSHNRAEKQSLNETVIRIKKENKQLKKNLQKIKGSKSYTIGKAMTYIPRTIRKNTKRG